MKKYSFDLNEILITQYGGIVHGFNKDYAALSHYGYRATDIAISGENKLYAPCALKCVFHNYVSSFECVASVFETLGSVACADGKSRELTFLMFHGGTTNGGSFKDGDTLSAIPELGKSYNKNDHIYKMGLDGLGYGAHIHIDILDGHITQNGQDTITESELKNHIVIINQPYYENQPVSALDPAESLNFHEVFFDTNGIAFNTYARPGESSAYDVWGEDIEFVKSSIEEEPPFDPTGQPDGWMDYEGNTYYVKDEEIVTGWQVLPITNGSPTLDDFYFNGSGILQRRVWIEGTDGTYKYVGADGRLVRGWFKDENTNSWYLLDYETGVMQTGWVADGEDALGEGLWYYLSPTSGVMQVNCWVDGNNYYVGSNGIMVTGSNLENGWLVVDGEYYYFKHNKRDTEDRYKSFAHGQKVTSTWIPGSSWCYVLSDGVMAHDCQILENGKYYKFDSDGYCIDSNGQSTPYPDVPVKL